MKKIEIAKTEGGFVVKYPTGKTVMFDTWERANKALEGALSSTVLEISFKNGNTKKGLLKSIAEGLFAFRLDGVSARYYENNAEITCHVCPVVYEDIDLLKSALEKNDEAA